MKIRQSILVTGAAGYIGRHVVAALLQQGAKVTAIDIVKKELPGDVDFIRGDILHDPYILKALPALDGCVHLAWQDGFRHNANSHLQNLYAHYKFLMALAELKIKRLTVMGSMHEVGYWEGPVTEDTPCSPLSNYGIAKNSLRQALFVALKDSSTILQWLRGFYIYGDDWSNHSIFTKLLEADRNGQTRFPFTSGKNKYDFITVNKLADMVAKVALQDKTFGIINICSGTPLSLSEAVESFIKNNHLDIKLEYGAFPDRPYDSPGIWGDATKINKIMATTNF